MNWRRWVGGLGADDPPDWGRLAASADTLVIYMGVGNLPQIQAALLLHGHSPETPVEVVRWGLFTESDSKNRLPGFLGKRREQKAASQQGEPPSVLFVMGFVSLSA
jgi:siroheme synthase